ncbi:heme peroxidase [Punctularia strigosozonata HHB-11173 SS5]|uniref:Peroxidase n=1 Tax=Punctularia strigosozonata (strain HHB-11173) TaxID=741275 RepID=R7S563_PUNST|nr:heme peroxidase [Punctularia strigosozonata HHB-11173 SS5]EIN05069.1 heme peroxidase [Punctularia strigosozonata HHB-11173 SS5]
MSPSLSAVSLTALVAAAQGVRGAYYPSAKYAALEHLLVDSTGHNANTFYKAVTPCGNYVSENSTKTGRVTSAQWMRVAFHDFATADVAAGTGGLDASIVFEYTRPENSGQAFPDSFNYWKYYVGAQTSFSDIIALGTVAAISSCGGPQLVYSAGRIDATAAGQFGVPEPDEGLTDTLARFAGAGISQTDAIKLTACGHTVGSVHHAGFPLVVGTDAVNANNTQGGINMDTTGTTYDNRIAQEYVAGTTKNPLVTSFNVSQRSDLRLFSSDNNATMSTLAESSSLFASECKRLTTQMLNTVPSGVSLTEITPIAVKPVNVTLTVNSAGTVTFSGAIRVSSE